MKNALLFVTIACVGGVAGCWGGESAAPEDSAGAPNGGIEFEAEDGTTVFAKLRQADGDAIGVILMFHQAGSNMHEYDPIAPRVVAFGYDCLTVDLRAGGDMWDSVNRTAAQFSAQQGYLDAYQDLEAALAWAVEEEYETILAWGSSYSASLALRLAAENGSVDGVLSFSPGEYFDTEGLVAGWNSEIGVPCLFAATSQELQGGAYDIYDAAPKTDVRNGDMMFGANTGVHGSSTLYEELNPDSNELYWSGVEQFLLSIESGGRAFGG